MGTALIQFIPSDGPDSNSYQRDEARTKSQSDLESATSSLTNNKKPKQRWPLWKKMVIFAFLLVFLIPLAVGLPIGLCTSKQRHAVNNAANSQGDNNQGDNNDQGESSVSSSVLASATSSSTDDASASASASDSASASASITSASAASPSATGTPPTSVWQPAVGATWQIVLSEQVPIENGKPVPDVEVYDMDLFDVTADHISQLHAAGKKVVCYFSAGSYEDWRPDAKDWDKSDLGSGLKGWQGENWVKTGSPKVRSIMQARLKMAAEKGCDAVDPDNVDGYNNENGLGLTEDDAADFVKFLGAESAKLNMGCGLKNAADLLPKVVDAVQFSVVEQCAEYKECAKYDPMIQNNKPVFAIEYPPNGQNEQPAELNAACNADGSNKFSKVLKNMNLDTWVEFCDGRLDM